MSSTLRNGCFSRSLTMFLATVSPSPSMATNGGYISLSFLAIHTVASLSYKSTFKNFIPRAVASRATFKLSAWPFSLLVASKPLAKISSILALIAS